MTQHYTAQQLLDLRERAKGNGPPLTLEECKKFVEQKRAERFNARAAAALKPKKSQKGPSDEQFQSTLDALFKPAAPKSGTSDPGSILSGLA